MLPLVSIVSFSLIVELKELNTTLLTATQVMLLRLLMKERHVLKPTNLRQATNQHQAINQLQYTADQLPLIMLKYTSKPNTTSKATPIATAAPNVEGRFQLTSPILLYLSIPHDCFYFCN